MRSGVWESRPKGPVSGTEMGSRGRKNRFGRLPSNRVSGALWRRPFQEAMTGAAAVGAGRRTEVRAGGGAAAEPQRKQKEGRRAARGREAILEAARGREAVLEVSVVRHCADVSFPSAAIWERGRGRAGWSFQCAFMGD